MRRRCSDADRVGLALHWHDESHNQQWQLTVAPAGALQRLDALTSQPALTDSATIGSVLCGSLSWPVAVFLIGQPALLELLTSQSRTALRPFYGHITRAELLGSDGGLARYRLVIEP